MYKIYTFSKEYQAGDDLGRRERDKVLEIFASNGIKANLVNYSDVTFIYSKDSPPPLFDFKIRFSVKSRQYSSKERMVMRNVIGGLERILGKPKIHKTKLFRRLV